MAITFQIVTHEGRHLPNYGTVLVLQLEISVDDNFNISLGKSTLPLLETDSQGKVKALAKFDRETKSKFELSMQCQVTNGRSEIELFAVNFSVQIQDINDSDPIYGNPLKIEVAKPELLRVGFGLIAFYVRFGKDSRKENPKIL